jgi:hypothetical protein
VADTTSRAASESPSIAAKCVDVLFYAGVSAVARTEGMCALPSVGRSLMQSLPRVFDVGAGVCVCCVCVRACVRGRSSATVAGGASNTASGR